jgi:glutathione S-transferase
MKGRAEVARFLFAISGQEYEDVRIEKDDWPNQKVKMPFNQIPVLEVNDGDKSTLISQSFTIARFLARKFNLDGNSELEKAQVDMVVEQFIDLQNAFIKAHFEESKNFFIFKLAI